MRFRIWHGTTRIIGIIGNQCTPGEHIVSLPLGLAQLPARAYGSHLLLVVRVMKLRAPSLGIPDPCCADSLRHLACT